MFLFSSPTRRAEINGQAQDTLNHEIGPGSVMDPITHRTPGRFGHRQRLQSESIHHVTEHFALPSTSAQDLRESPVLYSPSSAASAGPSHPRQHPFTDSSASPPTFSSGTSAEYSVWDRWTTLPCHTDLGGGPLDPQERCTLWVQPEGHQWFHVQDHVLAPGPQICVTSEARDSGHTTPLPLMHRADVDLSFPPEHSSMLLGVERLPPPLSAQRFPGQSTHESRALPARRLPRLQTSSLEPRESVSSMPEGSPGVASRWFVQTASPLLSPPELHGSHLAHFPQQASPNSSTSSLTTPSSATSITFVSFDLGQSLAGRHEITEDTSISRKDLDKYFPPSAQGPVEVSSKRGTPGRKWTCQAPGCLKSVRRQDRLTHALDHQDRKRFLCSCGASFARSQDMKRHCREQAPCRCCGNPVGRKGTDGTCHICSLKRHGYGQDACP